MALPTSGSAGASHDSQATSATTSSTLSDADMTQAFQDLARGEQTALALEFSLTSLERKLDDFLATFEESERQRVDAMDSKKINGDSDGKKP